VLAGAAVTNTGNTVINGNVGVYSGSSVTGFPPGIVTGGVIHSADSVAMGAQNDLTTAFVNAAGRPSNGTLPGDIGGLTFLPGVYTASSGLGITGTVTLNGNGNSSAVFIFQVGSALTTADTNSTVNLIGGAQASNVFWQIGSSATLGTSTIFNGTILAQASITLNTGAVLNGRALARIGTVSLAGNAIVNPGPSGAPGTISLSCPAPNAQIGQPYFSALEATGGLPPYTYSVNTGVFGPTFTLNPTTGIITGTPTASATDSFGARAVDSIGGVATANCSITISPTVAPLAPTPAPSSLILVLTALGVMALYYYGVRRLRV
jgi:hypothetical protein